MDHSRTWWKSVWFVELDTVRLVWAVGHLYCEYRFGFYSSMLRWVDPRSSYILAALAITFFF